MNQYERFKLECANEVVSQAADLPFRDLSRSWFEYATRHKYSYHFDWLGRPIVQYPQDIVAMQELIWRIKPDLVIETGIAHGGSLIFSASMLALLDYCDAAEDRRALDPQKPSRRVLGIDVDIRPHNLEAIRAHPLSHRIDMIQGSSIAPEISEQVSSLAVGYENVLVCLDSNHTHDHVLAELEAYAHLVSKGSYCCVFDTVVEDLPDGMYPDRPWGRGNNPKTAVWEYMRLLKQEGRKDRNGEAVSFELDKSVENKLLITVAPDGFMRRR